MRGIKGDETQCAIWCFCQGIPVWSWPDSERLHRFQPNMSMRGFLDSTSWLLYIVYYIHSGILSNCQALLVGSCFTTRPWMFGYACCFIRPDPQLFDQTKLRHAETWCTTSWQCDVELMVLIRFEKGREASTVRRCHTCFFPSIIVVRESYSENITEVPRCPKYFISQPPSM